MPALTPLSISSDRRVRMSMIGGDMTLCRLWKKIPKCAANGAYCGDFFKIADLPVSTRHNDGEGVLADGDDRVIQALPTHWLNRGWRRLEELPEGWEQVNEATTAKQRQLNAEQNPFSGMGQALVDVAETNRLIARALAERSNGAGEGRSGPEVGPGLAGAEGAGPGPAAGRGGGRRGG